MYEDVFWVGPIVGITVLHKMLLELIPPSFETIVGFYVHENV